MGYPSIFPTGTLIYDKEKTFNGYTIFPSAKGALLIDMNGREVQLWAGLGGFPNKILPGGYVMGTTGTRPGKKAYQDQIDLVQVDWDGNIVWKFDKTELIADGDKDPVYMARQHHDYQREGSTVGYYYPGGEPKTDSGNTLILTHENLYNHDISDKRLIDETNQKMEENEDELLEIPRQIRDVNRKLMLQSMGYFYEKIRVNKKESDDIDAWINQVRVDLKKNIIRKQNRDINNREIYAYLHDIFGPSTLDLFDIHYEDEDVEEDSAQNKQNDTKESQKEEES